MDIISATAALASLEALIDRTAEQKLPVTISGSRHAAVLVSQEEWNNIQETLYLLSIPGMRDAILAARAEPLGESSKELHW
ncbi:type II toxin-antitoxin system Phd/YefM family antitoxin [Oxalobacteraceae bacterium A2-2]